MKRILFFLSACLFLSACATTGSKTGQIEDIPQEPLLFADWQYKGFGEEYPQWAEDALKNEAQSEISISFGSDLDMLLHHDSDASVVAETWVYIDPYYYEYEERYAYITLRQAQGPQRDAQGMEE